MNCAKQLYMEKGIRSLYRGTCATLLRGENKTLDVAREVASCADILGLVKENETKKKHCHTLLNVLPETRRTCDGRDTLIMAINHRLKQHSPNNMFVWVAFLETSYLEAKCMNTVNIHLFVCLFITSDFVILIYSKDTRTSERKIFVLTSSWNHLYLKPEDRWTVKRRRR